MTTTSTPATVAPNRWPVLGHAPAFLRDPLAFLTSLPAQGDLVEVRMGTQRMFVVCCPELTYQVVRDGRTFDKGGPHFAQLRVVLGDGLVSCPHAQHQRQRRLLQPAFHHDRLVVYAAEMSRQLDAALRTWRDGQVIDVLAAMDGITARVSTRTLFSATLSAEQSADLLRSLTMVVDGLFLGMLLPGWARAVVPALRRFDRALSTLDALTYAIIGSYRRDGVDHGDLLSMILAARDEHGDALSDTEIRDQVLTFLLGGTETSASLLAWSLHLLGQHPEAARRVQAEVDDVLDGRVATYDDVARLDYTARVLTETLRLYPPGWMFTRVLTTEATLADRTLPAGTVLLYSPYLVQRRPDLYPDPGRFDPERWPPGHPTTQSRSSFIAFGAGARKCIGDTFGMLEATLALATIAARWQLNAVPGAATHARPRVSLRPHPLRMRLHRRHQ